MVRYSLRSTWTYSRLYLTENRLLSAGGKLISVPGGYRLENYSDGVMLVSKNGLYGYMTPELSWICPAMFDDAHPFYQGLAVVGSGGRYGMIDTDGNTVSSVGQVSPGSLLNIRLRDGKIETTVNAVQQLPW